MPSDAGGGGDGLMREGGGVALVWWGSLMPWLQQVLLERPDQNDDKGTPAYWYMEGGPLLPVVWEREVARPGEFRGFNGLCPEKDSGAWLRDEYTDQEGARLDTMVLDPERTKPWYSSLWGLVVDHEQRVVDSVDRAIQLLDDASRRVESPLVGSWGYVDMQKCTRDGMVEGKGWQQSAKHGGGDGVWLANLMYLWGLSRGLRGVIWSEETRGATHAYWSTKPWEVLPCDRHQRDLAALVDSDAIYLEGNMNLVISAPHGGRAKIDGGHPRLPEQVLIYNHPHG